MAAPKIYFPSLEATLVSGIKILLSKVDAEVARGVWVGVRRAPADFNPMPSKQITVRSDGGVAFDRVLKDERFGINIWAESFSEASELAELIEALLPLLPDFYQSTIKEIEITLSPTRVNEDSEEEQRYLAGSATLSGKPLTLIN